MFVSSKKIFFVIFLFLLRSFLCADKCDKKHVGSRSVCSEHGECKKQKLIEYKCVCDDSHYTGDSCEKWTCDGIQHTDENVCNKKGDCIAYNKCKCKEHYVGPKCNFWYCDKYMKNDTRTCTGHGDCYDYNKCKCKDNYFNDYCDDWSCYSFDRRSVKVCSSHGECAGYNNCSCSPHYFDENCDNWKCYNVSKNDKTCCSGHGTCQEYNNCQCIAPYHGIKCNSLKKKSGHKMLYKVLEFYVAIPVGGVVAVIIGLIVLALFIFVGIFLIIKIRGCVLKRKKKRGYISIGSTNINRTNSEVESVGEIEEGGERSDNDDDEEDFDDESDNDDEDDDDDDDEGSNEEEEEKFIVEKKGKKRREYKTIDKSGAKITMCFVNYDEMHERKVENFKKKLLKRLKNVNVRFLPPNDTKKYCDVYLYLWFNNEKWITHDKRHKKNVRILKSKSTTKSVIVIHFASIKKFNDHMIRKKFKYSKVKPKISGIFCTDEIVGFLHTEYNNFAFFFRKGDIARTNNEVRRHYEEEMKEFAGMITTVAKERKEYKKLF